MKNHLITTLCILLFFCSALVANSITVTTLDDQGSASDGFCSLREAILAASTNSAIDTCTAGEVFVDIIDIDPSIVPADPSLFRIELQSSITIFGGDLQIIGPNNSRLEINGVQSVGIFRANMNDGTNLQLSNLRLKDAQLSSDGAAIKVASGVAIITIDNLEFINNTSNQAGGAISTGVDKDLQLFISNSTFRGNSAPRGGAISITTQGNSATQFSVEISQSKFINNSATAGAGGALYTLPFDASSFISISISDSLIEMNTATGSGGAISASGQQSTETLSVDLFRNLFYRNFSSNGSGGAYRTVNLDTTLVNNTFIENSSDTSGGAIETGNTAGDRDTIIIANTFYNNIGGTGSPFTVAKEVSVRFRDTPSSINVFQANLISTDLSNQTDDACLFNGLTALTTTGYNVVNDVDCMTSVNDINQINLRLRVETGPTDIYPVLVRLLPNSVAIDHWIDGQCQFNASPLETDMIGLRRDNLSGMAFDGDADNNFDCDAGAIEAPTAEQLDITVTGTGLAYEHNFAIGCNSNCTMPIPAGEDVLLLALSSAGSVFNSWTDACTGAMDNPCNLTINSQTTVGVVFSNVASTSVLSVDKIGDGLVTSDVMGIYCGGICRAIFENNSLVNLTATPLQGSIFSGWTGICSGMGICSVTIDDAVTQTVQATFINQNYLLDVNIVGTGVGTVTSNPTGIDCAPDCDESYPAGTMVEITATANGTDVFAGFTGDCIGTGSCILTMDQDHSVTAEFNAIKTLSVSITGTGQVTSNPVGIDCPGDCSEQANQFTNFTLQAIETDPNQMFVGWIGDCTPTGDGTTCVSSLISNSNVTARFASENIFADGFE